MILSFKKIEAKIGLENIKKVIEYIESNDFESAAAMALKYYDKTYTYAFDNNITPIKHFIEVPNSDFSETAEMLMKFADTEGL